MNNNLIDITTLGLKDGKYQITKTIDAIYINNGYSVEVMNGVYAEVIDYSCDKEINYLVNKDATLKLHILNSKNTKRNYEVFGELLVNHIVLSETNEVMNASLNDLNARIDYKLLNILKNEKSSFIQRVDHKSTETVSNISNFGVAMDGAKITFDTTGFIKKGMNKTNCRQLSKGVVMDDTSSITSKPILLIDEYDCFASHGAAIGKMSDEELFYLMSRGLTKTDAFLLILNGIIKPFIDEIKVEDIKKELNLKLNDLISE